MFRLGVSCDRANEERRFCHEDHPDHAFLARAPRARRHAWVRKLDEQVHNAPVPDAGDAGDAGAKSDAEGGDRRRERHGRRRERNRSRSRKWRPRCGRNRERRAATDVANTSDPPKADGTGWDPRRCPMRRPTKTAPRKTRPTANERGHRVQEHEKLVFDFRPLRRPLHRVQRRATLRFRHERSGQNQDDPQIRRDAQRLVRPHARALPDFNTRSPRTGREAGQTVTVKQSHGGSGQAGARGDRRPRGGRRHAGARLRHRRDRRQAGLHRAGLAEAAAAQQRALHVHHRLPRAQGQPEGHQGLGRPGQAGHAGHHAEPEDVRRRALELPGRVGLRAASKPGGNEAKAQGVRARSSIKNVPVLDSGARGSTTTFVAARHRRRAAGLGERGAPGAHELGQDKFEIVVPSISILAEPPVAVVDKVVDAQGTRERRRGVPASTSTRPKARRSPPSTTTVRAIRPSPRKYADQLPEGQAVHHRRGRSAAGRRRRRRTSPTAACSIRSTSRARATVSRGQASWPAIARPERRVLPGFGLTLGYHAALPEPHRPHAALDALRRRRSTTRRGRQFWRDVIDRRAWSRRTGSVSARRSSRRSSTPSSACSSPGCWSATGFRASGSSTRWSTCRSRCRRRSPASR